VANTRLGASGEVGVMLSPEETLTRNGLVSELPEVALGMAKEGVGSSKGEAWTTKSGMSVAVTRGDAERGKGRDSVTCVSSHRCLRFRSHH
jgi:hypothetical protein